ncbi:MAG: class I SAM-dependent methyltransferase [Xanthomonadales bacterium]|nr:class I SAM-dependent methyltransferase [Xanthomonadales bacterium]
MPAPVAELRRRLESLRRTPLHPQWLLGDNTPTLEWVREHAKGRVLDIGCADRWIEPHLPKGCDYIGLDHLATGGLLYGARPDIFADASRLPLADASIDTVLLLEVLEHLRHPAQALSEIARVLRPGGQLLLTMPFLYPVHDAPHDYQRYTCHGLAREMEAAGLVADSPTANLGSIQTAGLLLNLALGGTASRAIADKHVSAVLLPLIVVAIPAINLTCWLLGKVLPSWPALTAGYCAKATRP